MKENNLLWLCFIFLFSLIGGTEAYSQVQIELGKTFENAKIEIVFRDSSYQTTLNETGTGTISVPVTLSPCYATLHRPRGVYYFYLIPGKQQSLTRLHNGNLKFSGAGSNINEYLNSEFLRTLNLEYDKDEETFINEWETLPQKLFSHLDSSSFSNTFKDLERKRLYYVACNMLLVYPLYHARATHVTSYSPNEAYYQKLAEVIKEDPKANELWEYKQVYRDWIQTLVAKEQDSIKGKPLNKLQHELNYVCNHIKDPELADYLVYTYLSDHIRYFGMSDIDKFLPIYDEKVRNKQRKTEFEKLYKQYSHLVKGQKAPEFSLTDINGNQVKLSDFIGNYVYIDVWATWCIPCCRELPLLQKLEKQFANKAIRFISISIDANRDTWETKVKKEKLSGIQLHVGKDDTFKSDYKVGLIPHFILLDKEGKIVNAKMSRPSEPQTEELLKSLLNEK